MSVIFQFFKEKNPEAWTNIQTFVIDKHFLEWHILEKCFPDAKVLLCQFHALSYWEKVLRRKFGLKPLERDIVQTALQICCTEATCTQWYNELTAFARRGHSSVLKYFDDNRSGYCSMWANYRRASYFSAGNTTTNRIESNWSLLKRLLGTTTSVDTMVASLLKHQVTVVVEIQRHDLRSRPPPTIPDFLRRISAHMSNYVLKRVRRQSFVVHKSETTCEKREACRWEVFANSHVLTCDDVAWTCTCSFYTSQHLPCQHLMFVAREGHGFEELPPLSLDDRWNMDVARSLPGHIVKGVSDVTPVMDTVKLKPRCNVNTTSNANIGTLSIYSAKTSQVAFVRLARSERSENIVLTHAE
ncbi:Hypothetical protein PHPALM_12469 [Phytophthora palmivora]|uniref:SWIM-type domain-containing protein n=1 Tax=Phytophthora palmivora TaxID=4796 RepID=A0A2P4XZP5_9STRA|nr:Hypothetical protein PHPALM_12469 [Phytophthora palmivora]